MEKNSFIQTKVIVGPCRFSYLHVFTPQAPLGGGDAKYSVSLIIPKKDKATIDTIKAAIGSALTNGTTNGKFAGKAPKLDAVVDACLRDGDDREDGDEAYAGAYYVTAKSSTKPGVVDINRQPILSQDDLYSGCWGYASVNFYPYNTNGNKGVACGLNNLMKTKDGDYLGGRSSAESDFSALPFDEQEEPDVF